MTSTPQPPAPRGLALAFGWRRVRFTQLFALAVGLLMSTGWHSGMASILVRTAMLGAVGLVAFGLFEQWPRRLPPWLARWALQVAAVAVAMPLATLAIYVLSTPAGAPPFWEVPDRLEGFGALTGMGVLLAPWVALGALVRQREAMVRDQALAFDLERSELERQALDARLRLLQAQVAPHFLFNTLANVQALVDAGSPRAAEVLKSLVAYLRAAVPRLDEPAATLREELALTRAYLELMHMRIPDRLQWSIEADDAALGARCPPMALLTLVENAVRHGIDPSVDGGRIDVTARAADGRLRIAVRDSGVGLRPTDRGLGTGLAGLRERLRLVFGDEARLAVAAATPHGVLAELDLPMQDPRR